MSCTYKILISICPRTPKLSHFLQAWKAVTFDSPWSRCKSNFYVLIGQNLTGEFMRNIYAASGNIFTES